MAEMIDVTGAPISAGGANPGMSELGGMGGGAAGLFANNPGLLASLGMGGAMLGARGFGNNSLPFGGDIGAAAGNIGGAAGGIGAAAGNLMGFGQVGGMREGQLFGVGSDLLSSISSGKLPPGAEQSVQNQIEQAKTTIKGRYGALGQTGSTMEADALSNVENQATSMRFDIAQKMAQLGTQAIAQSLAALGLAGNAASGAGQLYGNQAGAFANQGKIYGDMMQAQMKQDADTSSSIGQFAAAAGMMAMMLI